jgi:hypothetical protein
LAREHAVAAAAGLNPEVGGMTEVPPMRMSYTLGAMAEANFAQAVLGTWLYSITKLSFAWPTALGRTATFPPHLVEGLPDCEYAAGSSFSAVSSCIDSPPNPPVSPKERSMAVERLLRLFCSALTSAATSDEKKMPYTANDITEMAPSTNRVSINPNPRERLEDN